MDKYLPTFLEILKYTLPALVVLWATYLIVNKFTVMELERKQLALLKEGQDTSLRLRLQAYERLALFIERIQPRQLLPRAYAPGLTVAEYQSLLSQSILAEFEHNLAQQIYVSWNVWQTVVSVKEQELAMINHIASQLNAQDDARLLQTKIIDFVSSADEMLPSEIGLRMIHEEAKKILSF